jgi:hypothetical protein
LPPPVAPVAVSGIGWRVAAGSFGITSLIFPNGPLQREVSRLHEPTSLLARSGVSWAARCMAVAAAMIWVATSGHEREMSRQRLSVSDEPRSVWIYIAGR